MNQEDPQSSLFDNQMGFTRNTTSYHSQSFSSNTSNSFQRTITIDDDDDYDDDYENDDLGSSWSGNCVYSGPFLFLDMMWNLAFVVASVCVLLGTIQEKPSTPLRLWVCGYALQCLLHVVFVWDEYQRRSLDYSVGGGFQGFYFRSVFSFSAFCHNSIMKKLESINTIVSSIWWVFGFYWIIMGGQQLVQDSPRLYWLSVVFLAFDVFFMFFCIAMACIVFFLLFCCFPILATVAYAMTVQDGASENDIKSLPKFLYRQQNNDETQSFNTTTLVSTPELVLNPEDSECCICLYKYVNGAELCMLPCNHHFHYTCITKWLRINATCPLCKLNIRKGEILV